MESLSFSFFRIPKAFLVRFFNPEKTKRWIILSRNKDVTRSWSFRGLKAQWTTHPSPRKLKKMFYVLFSDSLHQCEVKKKNENKVFWAQQTSRKQLRNCWLLMHRTGVWLLAQNARRQTHKVRTKSAIKLLELVITQWFRGHTKPAFYSHHLTSPEALMELLIEKQTITALVCLGLKESRVNALKQNAFTLDLVQLQDKRWKTRNADTVHMKLLDFLLFYQFKHKVSCLFRNHSTKTTLPVDQHISPASSFKN